MADGIGRLTSIALASLLAGVARPAIAAAQPAATQEDIVINAPPLFRDIQPERALDQDAIDSYGASTVGDILGDVAVELGEDAEQPLLIVNGQRVNDLSDIAALPVEVLRSIIVLPRGSALRAGGTGTQRVISITLKRHLRTETLTAAHKLSTEGSWNADRGEAMVTGIKGDSRANLTLRVRDETPLLESQRGIIQPDPIFPFAIGGNVVAFPDTSGEIDPALSALAGQLVTVAPLPATGAPSLAQLAASANQANTTDLGAFRTLKPATRNYDVNLSGATRLAPWLTANGTLHWTRNESQYLRGLPSALFILDATNPASPFANPVALAFYGKQPLRSEASQRSAGGSVTFDANWGNWQGNLNIRRDQSTFGYRSSRLATFAPIAIDDGFDPFTSDATSLMQFVTDRISSRSTNSLADLTLNGPAFALPAGEVQAVLEARVGWNHLRSTSTFAFGNASFRRDEQTVRGGLEVPLTSDAGFGSAIGNLSASLEYAHSHFSDAGSINHYTYGLNWEPWSPFRLHASIDRTDQPAPIQTLGGPVTITPGVRVFDPLTGQTVDVTQITGGNPLLEPQKTKTRDISALLRLVPKLHLELNAEYTDVDIRNFVSSLPEASAAVELAFPDRYVRDANGVLTTVDLTPVNFDSQREKRLRWGLSMNAKLGGGLPPGTPGAGSGGPGTYFQLTANHTVVFSSKILIRPGLDPVDLLSGGAIGIGGGRPRHQIDATAALTSGGLGARIGVSWRGPNELVSRFNGVTDTLHFSSLLAVNLRAFTDVHRFLPHSPWSRGFRVALDVINVTNRRQSVRDSFGNTPLQYQSAYRDPLGRTIELELRKVF